MGVGSEKEHVLVIHSWAVRFLGMGDEDIG
jgi:hypothetical protein